MLQRFRDFVPALPGRFDFFEGEWFADRDTDFHWAGPRFPGRQCSEASRHVARDDLDDGAGGQSADAWFETAEPAVARARSFGEKNENVVLRQKDFQPPPVLAE